MKYATTHRLRTGLLLLTLGAVLATGAFSAEPGAAALAGESSYRLDWWTADGGGSVSTQGGGYILSGTGGQPDAGLLEGDGYTLIGGFWASWGGMVRVYLPLVLRDWRGGNWEQEPNDSSGQANGPVSSGKTYHGAMPAGDLNDYFYFDLTSSGSAELWLTEIPGGCNYDLVLRDAALDVKGYSGNLNDADEHIPSVALPAGRYYVQVYHRSTAGSDEAYHLRVAYP